MPLKVTIVGAGLAGLIAARVLREQHEVTVLERYAEGHELGAAINLGPSAVKIVESLGFSAERVGSISAGVGRTFNQQGKKIMETDMTPVIREAGAQWYFQHRGDLWNEFAHLATAPSSELGITGNPSKIKYRMDVTAIDVDSGDVKLADGTTIASDLVIAADGIKSVIRPSVVGEEAFRTARPSGASAYRFTMTAELARSLLPGDILERTLDRTKPAVLDVHLALDGSDRSIVMYACRNFELLNFVCIAPDSRIRVKTTESWSATGTNEDLLDTYHDFEYLKPLLERVEDIKLWQLRDQDPLPTYIKGRTILVGDAAHAMTPHQGQGGTQAVEDAEAFRLFNDPSVTRDSVFQIMKDWDSVRRPRASQIQNNTREAHSRKSPETMYKHTKFNWCYPGVEECLARQKAGQPMWEV